MRIALRRPLPTIAVYKPLYRELHTTLWLLARSRPGHSVSHPHNSWPGKFPTSSNTPLQEFPLWQRPPHLQSPDSFRFKLEPGSRLDESLKALNDKSSSEEALRADSIEEGSNVLRAPTDVKNALVKAAELLAAGKLAFARLRIQQKLTAAILHLHRVHSPQPSQVTKVESSPDGVEEKNLMHSENLDEGELAYKVLAKRALELFLDARDLEGAEIVLSILHTHGAAFPMPLPLRARLAAARYASRDDDGKGKINSKVLLHSLGAIFRQRKFLRSPTTETDFHAILKQLNFVSSPKSSQVERDEKEEMLATMERVVQVYQTCQREQAKKEHGDTIAQLNNGDAENQNPNWNLGAWTLAFMISRNFESGRAKRAGYWLRQTRWILPHYRKKLPSSPPAQTGTSDSETTQDHKLTLPYKAYLFHALRLRHSPDQVAALTLPFPFDISPDGRDPRNIYRPFLERMRTDGVRPDSELLNIVLSNESERGAWGRIVSIYDELTHSEGGFSWEGVVPDEESYRLVFNARSENIRRRIIRRIQISSVGNTVTASGELAPLLPPKTSPELDIEEGKHRSPRMLFSDLIKHLTTPVSLDTSQQGSSARLDLDAGRDSAKTERTSPAITSALSYFVLEADYAAALVILRVIVRFEIGLQKGFAGSVLDALVERCRRELILPPLPSSSATEMGTLPLLPEELRRLSRQRSESGPRTNLGWVDLFLNLQDSSSAGFARRRIRSESVQETSRRVASIARRALAVAELDAMGNEASDASGSYTLSSSSHVPPSSPSSSSEAANSRVQGQEDPARENQHRDSPQTENTVIESPESHPHPQSPTQQRNLEVIDVLLSRALATECFLDGATDPSEAGRVAVEEAAHIMLRAAASRTKVDD